MAQKKYTNITLEQVEIITNPLRALKDGIKLIPALKYGEEKLSGIFLNKEKIATFFNEAGKLEDTGL